MRIMTQPNQEQRPALVALENQANAHYKNTRRLLTPALDKKLNRSLQHLAKLRMLLDDFIVVSSLIACQHHIGLAFTAVLTGEAEQCIHHTNEAEKWYQLLCMETLRIEVRQ